MLAELSQTQIESVKVHAKSGNGIYLSQVERLHPHVYEPLMHHMLSLRVFTRLKSGGNIKHRPNLMRVKCWITGSPF